MPPAGLSEIVGIAAGGAHSLALKKDGTVFGWGFDMYGQATGVPREGTNVVASGLVKIEGRILRDVVAIKAYR